MENYVTYHHSKIGWLKLSASENEVIKIEFVKKDGKSKTNKILAMLMDELDNYFTFKDFDFSKVNFAPQGTILQSGIYHALAKTKCGELISYSELASRANTNAIRVAASSMARNNFPVVIPCHRVINKDGTWGKFAGGESIKKKLILHEFEMNFRKQCIKEHFFSKEQVNKFKNFNTVAKAFGNDLSIVKSFDSYNDFYSCIVSQIIYQMIKFETAKNIELKLYALQNYLLTPEKILAMKPKDFTNIGISKQKMAYIINFTNDFITNNQFYANIAHENFDNVKNHMLKIAGIGLWTIEMGYIFYLCDDNFFSFDDLILEKTVAKLLGKELPLSSQIKQQFLKEIEGFETITAINLWRNRNEI